MDDREVFIVELPWVSQRLGEIIPTPRDFACYIEFMITKHGLDK